MGLLDNLLDLSKMESGKIEYQFEKRNVLRIVESVILGFRKEVEEKNLKMEVSSPTIPTIIVCDTKRIYQLIHNLISNAIKFTPEDKRIAVSFDEGQIRTGESVAAALKISVADQGVGIPENELDSVFDKFIQSTRTKTGAGGTGLGLAICSEIAKAHQGLIKAENSREGGAVFTVLLPTP